MLKDLSLKGFEKSKEDDMTEIKTPYDDDARGAAMRGDYTRANASRNMAEGYRAALARDVVPEAEIEAVLESFGLHKPEWEQGVSAMTAAIHALQLPKPTVEVTAYDNGYDAGVAATKMTRERLAETLARWGIDNGFWFSHDHQKSLADAILGGVPTVHGDYTMSPFGSQPADPGVNDERS